MTHDNIIGNRLRECRKKKGLSQDELARRLNYHDRSTIAKMESGKNAIPKDVLPILADALDVTDEYLSASLYRTLYAFDVEITENPDGSVRLYDPYVHRSVEYSAVMWRNLQNLDSFRVVWSDLNYPDDEERPTLETESEPLSAVQQELIKKIKSADDATLKKIQNIIDLVVPADE